jgi:prepilin-type N-terminal cleavage/methylation domain-containing protein
MRKEEQRGYSLIELLCVIAIISVLASLLLGPVAKALNKAHRFKWEMESENFADRFRERLTAQFGRAEDYPAFTPEALHDAGIIDTFFDFLKDKRVAYTPFSSKDPDSLVVLRVVVTRNQWIEIRKSDLKPKD